MRCCEALVDLHLQGERTHSDSAAHNASMLSDVAVTLPLIWRRMLQQVRPQREAWPAPHTGMTSAMTA